MKVSIITPAYNCIEYIKESIDSIINQTYTDWELIIGDDGSTDETKDIIDSYNDTRIKRYHSKQNQGYLRMFNYLLSKATGDFFMSHDADDISMPFRIEKQINVFKEIPNVGVVGTNSLFFGTHIEDRINNNATQTGLVLDSIEDLPFVPASIMYRKEVYAQIGGFNLFFDRLSSMDQYWIYLMREQNQIYYLSECLYRVRSHGTSNHRSVIMSDIKKLASWDIYKFLRQQRKSTGTDSLEQNDEKPVLEFVEQLGKDKFWLSEKYREYSAMRADVGDTRNAIRLGIQAVTKHPWRVVNYRTLFYALRKAIS